MSHVKTIDVLLFNGESHVPCVRRSDYDGIAAQLKARCDESDERNLEVMRLWGLMKEALPVVHKFCKPDFYERFKASIRDLP